MTSERKGVQITARLGITEKHMLEEINTAMLKRMEDMSVSAELTTSDVLRYCIRMCHKIEVGKCTKRRM